MKKLFILLLLFLPSQLLAQAYGGTSFSPSGIEGSFGFSIVEFDIKSPESNFSLDNGTYAALSGEKRIGESNTFITFTLGYMQAGGRANYQFSTLSTTYVGSDVAFDSNEFQIGLGFRLKITLIDWLKPYGEVGGLLGQNKLSYRISPAIVAQGNQYKVLDEVTSFGYYAEGGVETQFSQSFGVKAHIRFVVNMTRAVPTLGNNDITYTAFPIGFSIMRKF